MLCYHQIRTGLTSISIQKAIYYPHLSPTTSVVPTLDLNSFFFWLVRLPILLCGYILYSKLVIFIFVSGLVIVKGRVPFLLSTIPSFLFFYCTYVEHCTSSI